MNRLKLIYIGLSLIALSAPLTANDETRSCSSTPCTPYESCMKVEGRLNEIKADLNACCANLLSRCAFIRTKVGSPCDQSIPIDQAFINNPMRNPITQSGVYCLTETVSGSLVINADDVIILMNNHTISGTTTAISVTGNIFNLRKDIAILGAGLITASTTAGMSFTNCSNVVVDGVNFESNDVGLHFDNTQGIRLNALNFTDQNDTSLELLNGSSNGKINSCLFFDNNAALTVNVDNSSNFLFEACQVSNHAVSNFVGYSVSNSSNNCNFLNCTAIENQSNGGQTTGFSFNNVVDCYCSECQANSNVNTTSIGFLVNNSAEKIVLDSCLAMNNGGTTGRGFQLQSANSCCIINSIAEQNSNNGFLVTNTCQNCYVEGNVAIGNTNGFVWDSAGNNVFFSNFGTGNSGNNYIGIPGPITSFSISAGTFTPSNSSIWRNITTIA